MRPVLSAVNTPEYNLAKWLEKQIKSWLVDTYSVSSSIEYKTNKYNRVINPLGRLEIFKFFIYKKQKTTKFKKVFVYRL